MKISEIEINGFKSYGKTNTSVKFGNINIVIGPNGAGKSNFISFLEMIAYIATDAFGEYVAGNGYAGALMHARHEKIDYIEGKLIFSDDDKYDTYELKLKQGVNGDLFISNEKISYSSPMYEQPYVSEYRTAGKRSGLLDDAERNSTARILLNILRGCRVFHFNNTTMNSRMRMPGYVQDNRYLRADAGNLAAYLYKLKNNPELNQYYQRINDMVREVFPRFDGFSLHPQVAENGDESISLNWRERGCGEVFGPHMMSDGTLRFVALCTLLLRPVELGQDIIIMDEPEIGLHPYAVRVLSEMMCMVSKNVQIIATTQSKELLDSFTAGDVIIAEFDNDRESSILRRLSEKELNDWLDEYSLSELWDKNIIGGTP